MNQEKYSQRLYNFLARIKTRTLMAIMFSAVILCFFLLSALSSFIGVLGQYIFIALAFACVGMTGTIILVRQEVDLILIHFEGPLAVVLGVIIAVLGFSLAVIPFIGIK